MIYFIKEISTRSRRRIYGFQDIHCRNRLSHIRIRRNGDRQDAAAVPLIRSCIWRNIKRSLKIFHPWKQDEELHPAADGIIRLQTEGTPEKAHCPEKAYYPNNAYCVGIGTYKTSEDGRDISYVSC